MNLTPRMKSAIPAILVLCMIGAVAVAKFPGGGVQDWAAVRLATINLSVFSTDEENVVHLVNTNGSGEATVDVSDLLSGSGDTITGLGAAISMFNGEKLINSPDGTVAFQADDDAVDLLKFDLKSSVAGTANGDKITAQFMAKDSAGTTTTWATLRAQIVDVTDSSEDGKLVGAAMTAGTLADEVELTGANFYPSVDDGNSLGASGTRWLKGWLTDLDADGAVTLSTAVFQGATLYTAEGATADAHEKSIAVTDPTSDTTSTFPDYTGEVIQTGRVSQVFMFTDFIVGSGAGWVVTGANNGRATLPAESSASTLVVRLTGLHVGDIITAFTVQGQVESAGATATLDAVLYKNTSAAGDITEASIGAITQVSVTADAIVSASKTLDTPETIAADESFYVLVTGTTAALTDFALQGVKLTMTAN